MDSGNSSSMQSSSGGGGDQEEYDSRADQSISALFNITTTNITNPNQTHLDSLIANYLNTGWSTDTPPLWSTTPKLDLGSSRPQPISSSSEQQQQQIFFTNPPPLQQQQQQENLIRVSDTNITSPICSVPRDKKNGLNHNMGTTRNPKKRSRVSKRAPTTVLTTDTSNFRAMVQEFTGNPSTPFTGSSLLPSSFPRSRFDHLFGTSSSSSPTSTSRPLKPFPQKPISSPYNLIPPPPSSSSDYLLLNMNTTQNITNPYLNNQSTSNPLNDSSLLSQKSKPLMNFGGHVDTFGGLHNIITTTTTQPRTLNVVSSTHGDKNSDNDLLRSINGDDHQRSDVSGSENNRNDQGMVELSWISSSD